MNIKRSLKTKTVTILLLFTALLSAGTVFFSYRTYTVKFNEHYEKLAESISKTTATVVDASVVELLAGEMKGTFYDICDETGGIPDFESYTEADWESYLSRFEYITEMEEYKQLLALLTELREDNNVMSLYLGAPDLKTKKDFYLMDASDEPCLTGEFDETSEEDYEKRMNGDYSLDAYITNTEEYGWLSTAMSPILNDKGEVVGVALVDISMNEIVAERQMFVYRTGLIILVIASFMLIIMTVLIDKAMLKPLNSLSVAASGYIENKKQNEAGSQSGFEKLNIKTGDEIESLFNSVKQMEQDINRYISEVTLVTAEKERIGAELDVAKNIQSSMLPCIFPAFPERNDFDIYATMTPAKEVGGDFYDFFMVDDKNLAIVIADVSGKGVPAALFMVIGKTLIKDRTQPDKDLGEVFAEVNNLLCESNSESLFITAFEGVLNLETGELRYVNAGHEIPFIGKKNGSFEPHKVNAGFVLAGIEDIRYTGGAFMLEPGDKLFQYTDGVPESTDKDNNPYGMERLRKVLNENINSTPDDILRNVKADIDSFVGEAMQFDDITMLCLEYKGSNIRQMVADVDMEQMYPVTDFVENTLRESGVSDGTVIKMNIAVDEIFSNIIKFSGASYAKISCGTENGMAVLIFEDDGIPYNPLEKEDADISLSAEERELGGLGIYMVKNSMDHIEYQHSDGKNILTMKKSK